MSDTFVSNVSRETGDTSVSTVPRSGPERRARDRRSAPRAKVRCEDGVERRIGSSYSEQELADLRVLVENHCAYEDIGAHFKVSPAAIRSLCQRQQILRPRPSVADVLAARAQPHPEPVEGPPPSPVSPYPIVEIIDRFEKQICQAELREIDAHSNCRVVRHLGERAGQWATFALWQIRWLPGTDRKAELEAARRRGAETAARREALQHQP